MILTIEPIPEPTWYLNLRKLIPGTVWDNVRQCTYARFFYQCYICGKPHWNPELKEIEDMYERPMDYYKLQGGGLHAHEWWIFDDDTGIQKLDDVVALCPKCHGMKHIMLTIIHIREGKKTENEVIQHFCQVNQVSPEIFAEELEKALVKYEERSKREWIVDIGGFLTIIQPHFWNFVRDGLLIGKKSEELERYLNDCGVKV